MPVREKLMQLVAARWRRPKSADEPLKDVVKHSVYTIQLLDGNRKRIRHKVQERPRWGGLYSVATLEEMLKRHLP